jgi:hypothetical protein
LAILTLSDGPTTQADEILVHQAIGMTMEYLGCPSLMALAKLGGDQTRQARRFSMWPSTSFSAGPSPAEPSTPAEE